MLRRESALLLFITAALFVLMFPQSIIADRASCSLTVHSCVSQSGDKTSGTAVGDPGVPDDASPLPGVLYSLWKVGDVASQTLDGTVTLCACHINDEFIALLTPGGLPPDAGSPDEEPYYNLSKIQDAWEEAVKKDEAALTELVRTHGSPLTPCDAEGVTRADDISGGLYILAITEVPDRDDLRILSAHAPLLLMLPQMNTANVNAEGEIADPDDLWIYDVSVYPKSRTLESGKKILLSDKTQGDSDDRETGSTITFISYVNLPDLGDSAGYDEAVLDDNMTEGLRHKNIAKVVCGAWLSEDAISYDILSTYKELSSSSDYTVSDSGSGFRLTLADSGLDKINTLTGNTGLYVLYDVLLGSNAAVGTEGPEANEGIWTVSTDRTNDSYTLRSPLAHVASYGIDLIKTGLSDASEARFSINAGDKHLYFEKIGEGTYSAAGSEASPGYVSVLSPASDGHLRIRGLDSAAYTITETKTESGHSLLTSPFTVTLTGDPSTGSLDRAELRLGSENPILLSASAVNGGIAVISVSNESMITPLKAGDNGYWKVAAFILLFSSMLLAALLIRKRRLECGEAPHSDTLPENADRSNAAEAQNEKTQDQNTPSAD